MTSRISKPCCDSDKQTNPYKNVVWRSSVGEHFFAGKFKDFFAKIWNTQLNEENTWKLFLGASETLVKKQE